MTNKITLANLHEHTEQQVYDYIVAHLRNQGEKSEGAGGCSYLTVDGLKCAAGCLISEEEYDSSVEGYPWEGLVLIGIAPLAHKELIGNFQHIHDMREVSNWEYRFKRLADEFGLVYTEVTSS